MRIKTEEENMVIWVKKVLQMTIEQITAAVAIHPELKEVLNKRQMSTKEQQSKSGSQVAAY